MISETTVHLRHGCLPELVTPEFIRNQQVAVVGIMATVSECVILYHAQALLTTSHGALVLVSGMM
jgi:hypothetical protein